MLSWIVLGQHGADWRLPRCHRLLRRLRESTRGRWGGPGWGRRLGPLLRGRLSGLTLVLHQLGVQLLSLLESSVECHELGLGGRHGDAVSPT